MECRKDLIECEGGGISFFDSSCPRLFFSPVTFVTKCQ